MMSQIYIRDEIYETRKEYIRVRSGSHPLKANMPLTKEGHRESERRGGIPDELPFRALPERVRQVVEDLGEGRYEVCHDERGYVINRVGGGGWCGAYWKTGRGSPIAPRRTIMTIRAPAGSGVTVHA